MHPVLRRSLAGVAAAVLAYALTAVLAIPWLPQLLGRNRTSGPHVWSPYEMLGRPMWEAVGWVLLAAHGAPLEVVTKWGWGVAPLSLAPAPWLYLVGPVACSIAGILLVQQMDESKMAPIAVGVGLTLGYVPVFIVVAFVSHVGTASTFIEPSLWIEGTLSWLVVVALVSLVFGAVGAYVGSQPAVKRLLPTQRLPI